MKILILNCGSSSIKYKLIEMIGEQTLSYGLMERIGMHDGLLYHRLKLISLNYNSFVCLGNSAQFNVRNVSWDMIVKRIQKVYFEFL